MSYEVTITDAITLRPLCDVTMDRKPTTEEADYLAMCVKRAKTDCLRAAGPNGPKPDFVRESLKAFNTKYPLHAKLL